ncbi:MAG: F0F1 ATP synthase subunit epsilon [Proteobacteria bacterium]|nr:F0F1 ATP synthase subunit epsilon [Pseudomonadota bacterium]MBU0965936.1 F0F1 ATP synthase subunit epsilon [Pseudomonadota bacterium]
MNSISLGIYLPTRICWQADTVRKVIAEGLEGYFTLLPRHVDYIAVLVPGVLTVVDNAGQTFYFAVDHGSLVKQGGKVNISTRNCIEGKDFRSLVNIVATEFYQLDDLEKKARTALAGLEHSMLRRFAELKKR